MSHISTNPIINFKIPNDNVKVTAMFEHPHLLITPDGAVSGAPILQSMDANSVDIQIPKMINGISVTSIAERAFQQYESISSIIIPDGVTSIGAFAFDDCLSIGSINIPEGVTTIGDWAFGNCMSVVTITIPSSTIEIGQHSFNGCYSLSTININKPKDSIPGAPWDVPYDITINWLG